MQDQTTTTEYEVGRIVHINSVVGNNDAAATEFWIEGMPERQFCTESVNELRRLMRFKKPWIGKIPNWLKALAAVATLLLSILGFYLNRVKLP